MDWIQAVTLALIQGLTEFLPISSQAHLYLTSLLLGWEDQGLDFDVILHAGSLVAVCTYFRHEILAMTRDWLGQLRGDGTTANSQLAWWIIIGTVPAGIAGLLLKDWAELAVRSPVVIAGGLIAFGLLLGLADWRRRGERDEFSLTLRDVMVVGFAQALALIPGTSRSGITITAALFLGLSREAASRFSFLLSIPIIAAAGFLSVRDLARVGMDGEGSLLALGFIVSVMSTYACIHYFLMFIRRIGMQPFVVYRLLIGAVLLGLYL